MTMPMSDAFARFLHSHEQEMFRFLRDLVLQPSYSHDKEDVDALGRLIERELSDSSMSCEKVRQEKVGDHLLFRSPACRDRSRSILLVGHMDTVFPRASGFNWYRDEGERICGPGVIDMKGGLAAAVYALRTESLGETMPIVTLIAAPGGLETPLVEALRNAWGGTGGAARWLSRGEAAEFAVPEIPENRWNVWEDLQAQGVDLAVQADGDRRKRMLIADMDSTMIQQECIDELADEAGVGARVADITARAMNGELDFEGALRERVGLLKDLPADTIDKVLAEEGIDADRVAGSVREVLKLSGRIEVVAPGVLPRDGVVIEDTRSYD